MQQAAHPASMLTADQRRLLTTLKGLLTTLNGLQAEENWQGVVSLEGEALELATTVGGVHPVAAVLHSALGYAFQGLGQYARAREMHEQDKTISEELGDHTQVARACRNLGICYYSTGDYVRAR